MNLNKVILIGRIGGDPKTFSNATGLSVATSEGYKKDGEWVDRTEWHRIVCFKDLATKAAEMQKGDLVYVEGKLQTRKWTDNEGKERQSTEIIAFTVRRIVKQEPKTAAQPAQKPIIVKEQTNETSGSGGDDDLPF